MRDTACELMTRTAPENHHPAPRPHEHPHGGRLRVEQPLWLSKEEARVLITLCFASEACGGDLEPQVFTKLGDLFRSFSLQ